MQNSVNVFQPLAIATYKKHVVLLYGIKSATEIRLFLTNSEDGSNFLEKQEVHVFLESGKQEQITSCEGTSFFVHGQKAFITYSKIVRGKKKVFIAESTDMTKFRVIKETFDLPAVISNVSNHKYKQNFLAYYGGKNIHVTASSNLSDWHETGALLLERASFFESKTLQIIGTVIVERGILVLYAADNKKLDYEIKIGGALFSFDKPYESVWKSEVPILKEKISKKKYPKRFLGAAIMGESLNIYWSSSESEFFVKTINLGSSDLMRLKNARQLKKHPNNPILKPKTKNDWEGEATFNPAALYLDDKIHLLYRAIGEKGISVLGYASSNDGVSIKERLDYPIYELTKPVKVLGKKACQYVSGGSWAGCEDPRITLVGKRIYMTYVLFDGCNPPGVALTSISVSDFLHKIWKWKKPISISRHGEIQKNWMIFPQKINGKYAILHSITPKISIEYVDSLNDDKMIIESMKMPGADEHRWDNIVRGAGAPPLKTKYGWLVLYHAMDKRDPNKYKVGAMILDINDPTKILYRCKNPILEPVEIYENHGAKAGVVYVCGAVIKGETLFVYYGGADSVVCVATENLNEFLEDLVKHVVHLDSKPSLLRIINNKK